MTPSRPPKPYQWFKALAEVPGVVWMSPPGLVVDRRLSKARPVADERSFSPLGVAWTDGAGRPISDDYRTHMSPAELALEGRWQPSDDDNEEYGLQGDPVEVARIACQALALPGTRSDYHQALSWLSHVEGVPGALVERSLLADIELVLGDPADALISPWSGMTGSDRDLLLAGASDPIIRLINLYLTEGFLVEAAAAEKLLDRLPDAAEARPRYWRRPDEVASALTGLTR